MLDGCRRSLELDLFERDGGPYEFNKVNLRRIGIENLRLSRILYCAEGDDPSSLRYRCAEQLLQRELTVLLEQNYRLYLLLLGGTLSPLQAASRPNIRLANAVAEFAPRERVLVEKIYELSDVVKHALVVEVDASKYFEVFDFVNVRAQSLLVLSRSTDLATERVLDELFPLMSRTFDLNISNKINQGAICGLRCPLGDFVIRSSGEFDDDFRTAELIFDPTHHAIV